MMTSMSFSLAMVRALLEISKGVSPLTIGSDKIFALFAKISSCS
jgi:hypothetical protein